MAQVSCQRAQVSFSVEDVIEGWWLIFCLLLSRVFRLFRAPGSPSIWFLHSSFFQQKKWQRANCSSKDCSLHLEPFFSGLLSLFEIFGLGPKGCANDCHSPIPIPTAKHCSVTTLLGQPGQQDWSGIWKSRTRLPPSFLPLTFCLSCYPAYHFWPLRIMRHCNASWGVWQPENLPRFMFLSHTQAPFRPDENLLLQRRERVVEAFRNRPGKFDLNSLGGPYERCPTLSCSLMCLSVTFKL